MVTTVLIVLLILALQEIVLLNGAAAVRIHPREGDLRCRAKQKNQRNFYAGSFGGRGWMSRAALLKTAHRAVFAPSSAMSPQLFESTLESET